MFFKEEYIIFVYNHYIDGLSVEEILLKSTLFGFEDLNFKDINEIIDLVNLTIA